MSVKDQILQLVNKFKKENYLKDKTDAMGDGLLLGANLADEANELSKSVDSSFKRLQQEYTENGNGAQSTAELIAARDGEEVVNDRLNRDFVKVNEDLAQKTYFFKTVADLVASDKLKTGDLVITSGYYGVNDGGGATYTIKNEVPVKYIGIHQTLLSGLTAELIIKNNTINVKQLGATKTNDLKPYLLEYLQIYINFKSAKLYIPNGVWLTSATELISEMGFNIYGDKSFIQGGYTAKGTIITALNNNQDYVIKIGNAQIMQQTDRTTTNFVFEKIIVSTGVFENNKVIAIHEVIKSAFIISGSSQGFVDVLFQYISGTAFYLNDSWELYFGDLNFRQILNFSKPIMVFGVLEANTSSGSNISALDIKSIMFEAVNGDYIHFDKKCAFGHNKIGNINAEMSFYNAFQDLGTIVKNTNENITKKLSIINAEELTSLSVDNINLQYQNNFKYENSNGVSYTINTIFNVPDSGFAQISVSQIISNIFGKNPKVISSGYVNPRSYIQIGNISYYSETLYSVQEESLFDLNGFPSLSDIISIYRFKSQHNLKHIPFNSFPMFKYVVGDASNDLNLLYSDDGCINDFQIGVKSNGVSLNRTVAMWLNDKNHDISIRLKAPKGTNTIQLTGTLNGITKSIVKTFTSTGDWQNVIFETSTLDDNKLITIFDLIENYQNHGDTIMFDIVKSI